MKSMSLLIFPTVNLFYSFENFRTIIIMSYLSKNYDSVLFLLEYIVKRFICINYNHLRVYDHRHLKSAK